MSLSPGSTVGPYEILAPMGAGGMGEVYRARDSRLDRSVALKILRSDLGRNDELRARFEREARAISALSHPHVCALYDVGRERDTEYLVMELLEGETLADRLTRGPLPISLVLRHGAQIAEALQHAHRAGIMHRDLKPGNIMLTGSGVKLLDFGLAKVIESASVVTAPPGERSTAFKPLTAEGAMVGTFQYMSPEQIEGRSIDHRTDIFSLGIILYEMTTGQRPFRGSSTASVVASILASDPEPIGSLQPVSPPELERVILTSLEKSPDDRWQTAQDMARQLRWIGESSQPGHPALLGSAPRHARLLVAALAIAIAAAAVTWMLARRFARSAPDTGGIRLHLVTPTGVEVIPGGDTNAFAISPDGRTLCFAGWSESEGSRFLYLRNIDSFDVKKIEGSEQAVGPFWSPDGNWIAFSARGKLWKTRVAGVEAPIAICEVTMNGVVGSWSHGQILFAEAPGGAHREILRVADSGGEVKPATSLSAAEREWRHAWPYFLPDGKHFIYESFVTDSFDRQLVLASLDAPERTSLVRNVSQARFAGEMRLVYVQDGRLLGQEFDLDRRQMVGDPVTIATGVSYFYATARADFDASQAGVIVYRTETGKGELVRLDRKGAETSRFEEKGFYFHYLGLSPDGRNAAVTVRNLSNGLGDLWIYDLSRGVREPFASEPQMEFGPVWAPDGQSIVYSRSAGGTIPHVVRRPISGAPFEVITPPGTFQVAHSFSPDGAMLYLTRRGARWKRDILRMTLATKQSDPFLDSEFDEGDPAVSPDGKWLAFGSNATGRHEIYLMSLVPGEQRRIRVSNTGGLFPRWRADGRELFYSSGERRLMSVIPRTPGGWEDPIVAELFPFRTEMMDYAPLPDGASFLVAYWTRGPQDSIFNIVIDRK